MSSVNYNTLQNVLDKLLGKIGLDRTILYLESFLKNTSVECDKTETLKLVTDYIIARSIIVFDLDEDRFFKSKIPEYRDARMACFHLLRNYTDSSYSRIGQRFGIENKRHVHYFVKKCDEILSIPQFYKSFVGKYRNVESQTINFLSKL